MKQTFCGFSASSTAYWISTGLPVREGLVLLVWFLDSLFYGWNNQKNMFPLDITCLTLTKFSRMKDKIRHISKSSVQMGLSGGENFEREEESLFEPIDKYKSLKKILTWRFWTASSTWRLTSSTSWPCIGSIQELLDKYAKCIIILALGLA